MGQKMAKNWHGFDRIKWPKKLKFLRSCIQFLRFKTEDAFTTFCVFGILFCQFLFCEKPVFYRFSFLFMPIFIFTACCLSVKIKSSVHF